MAFIPDDPKETADFVPDEPSSFVPDKPKRPSFGFAPGKELDLEGFGVRDEEQFKPDFSDPSLPKAKVRNIPGV